MPHGITKGLVESTIHSHNEKLERLGWARRYAFQLGSNQNGVKHVLQVIQPGMSRPSTIDTFNTLSKVYQYLLAMGTVLNDALAERELRRMAATASAVRMNYVDPDSRSARRNGEVLG